ncbi:putative plasmid transfer protein [Escherichia coli]|nr:putative plasmid transfer protein [Escherichia coli]
MLKTFGTVSVDGKVSDADLNYLESIADSGSQDVDKNRLTSQAFCPCRTDHRCGRCAGH